MEKLLYELEKTVQDLITLTKLKVSMPNILFGIEPPIEFCA